MRPVKAYHDTNHRTMRYAIARRRLSSGECCPVASPAGDGGRLTGLARLLLPDYTAVSDSTSYFTDDAHGLLQLASCRVAGLV